MKKKVGIAAGILAVLILVSVGVFVYLNMSINKVLAKGRIMDGVECDGIDLSGMTKDEAEKVIEQYIKKLNQDKMTFYVDDEKAEASIDEFGAGPNAKKTAEEAYNIGRTGSIFTRYSEVKKTYHQVFLYRSFDKALFKKKIKKLTKDFVSEPKNATVKREDGKFVVTKEKTGYVLDVDETFSNFKQALDREETECELAVVKKKPKFTTKDVEKIKDVMGTYTTEYGTSAAGRKANVAAGTKKINGTVIYPGETFSVYKKVSPFTKKNGYELAGSYENGQTVQTYGGGICQVSTTLYNAVIRAELTIKERHPHSMTVAYVPRSADAAIAGTSKDLKIKNDFDFPIYIEGKANGSSVTFTVYGVDEDPNRTVEFVSETTSVKASSEKTVKDPTLKEGERVLEQAGHTGYTAKLWKIVKVNGKQTKKEVFNTSTYMATPSTYRVGTKQEDEDDDDDGTTSGTRRSTSGSRRWTTRRKKTTTEGNRTTAGDEGNTTENKTTQATESDPPEEVPDDSNDNGGNTDSGDGEAEE